MRFVVYLQTVYIFNIMKIDNTSDDFLIRVLLIHTTTKKEAVIKASFFVDCEMIMLQSTIYRIFAVSAFIYSKSSIE